MKRGEIWDAYFPFKDAPSAGKHRPVVVIGWSSTGPGEDAVVLVVPITSFGDGGRPLAGDVELVDWRKYRLNQRSWVRARRLFSADHAVFDRKRGPRGRVSGPEMSDILVEIEKLVR